MTPPPGGAIVRAVVQFSPSNNVPQDKVINTFHFDVGAKNDAVATAITAHLQSLYNDNHDGHGLHEWMSDFLSRDTHPVVKYYDELAGGSPWTETQWPNALGAFTPYGDNNEGLPPEIACCLSYHSSLVGVPANVPHDPPGPAGDEHLQARRRGRVFLGPFTAKAATSWGQPDGTLLGTIAAAASDFLEANNNIALDGAQWVIFSNVDQDSHDVIGGWVDDRFDGIRRRRSEPTARTLWP